jgi:hypothetical protein
MSVGARSYGTAAKVAALTGRWTNAGAYDATTNPTLATVEGWIDDISAMMNVVLKGAGFTVPVTQEDAKAAIGMLVVGQVAELCNAAHSTGKFYSEKALERGEYSIIRAEIDSWVKANADGLELLGAARERAGTAGVLYRGSDRSGEAISPIFQRKGFSNRFEDVDR